VRIPRVDVPDVRKAALDAGLQESRAAHFSRAAHAMVRLAAAAIRF
jgi:hypothetical protein